MQPIRALILVFIILVLAAPDARAIHWERFATICLDELEIPKDFWREDIPVGCEVVDCCPGCPGPPLIDWRILVARGTPGATLRFEGLSERQLAALTVSGNAKVAQGVITLGPGETIIKGLPRGERGKVAVGLLELQPPSKGGAIADAANGAPDGGVQVVQSIGRFTVNRYSSAFRFRRCGPTTLQDRIRTNNNTTSDSTIVLADYRQGGCQNDRIHRSTTSVGIGNAVANGGCNSDVAVFSDDNAMSFQTGVTTWTAISGDIHTASLQPILTAPVTIWLARAGAAAAAANDLANANFLYNTNNVGVQFAATVNDVSGNAAAVATIGTGCGSAAAVQGSAFFTAGRLNVYYVDSAFTGVNCGLNFNINYIGTTANIGSLPHEFGHAYGMRPIDGGHVNGIAGFGNNNIMWGGGPATRDWFTIGQAFRLNVHTPSMLNTNGTRTGTTRNCLPLTTSNICPALALDAAPH